MSLYDIVVKPCKHALRKSEINKGQNLRNNLMSSRNNIVRL